MVQKQNLKNQQPTGEGQPVKEAGKEKNKKRCARSRLAAGMSIWMTESFFLTQRGTELFRNRKYSIKREGIRTEFVMLLYRPIYYKDQ